MATICLNMIVKNEAAIIRDTLANIVAHVDLDYYVVSDTGSTDGTAEIIRRFFEEKGIAGEIFHDPWQNFAYNRNQALKHAEGKTDYVLFFDADDRFEGEIHLPALSADRYNLRMSNANGNTIYFRPLLMRNDGSFYWRGVLHEFIAARGAFSDETVHGNYRILSGRFGARSNDPNKYLMDALVLEKAFYSPEDEDLKPRYAFYTARSYWDAEMPERAYEWFKKRIDLGGWKEEVTVAYEQLGFVCRRLGREDEALSVWLKGYDYNPARAECIYHAMKTLRERGQDRIAHQLGLAAKKIVHPKNDILFVKDDLYRIEIDYELSLTSYAAGNFKQGYESCRNILLQNPYDKMAVVTMQNMLLYKEYADGDDNAVLARLLEVMKPYEAQGGKPAEAAAFIAGLLQSRKAV